MERKAGIEPASSAWKAEALAVGRLPRTGSGEGIRTPGLMVMSHAIYRTDLPPHQNFTNVLKINCRCNGKLTPPPTPVRASGRSGPVTGSGVVRRWGCCGPGLIPTTGLRCAFATALLIRMVSGPFISASPYARM